MTTLVREPLRVGKPLRGGLTGIWSARRGTYRVREEPREVIVPRINTAPHIDPAERTRAARAHYPTPPIPVPRARSRPASALEQPHSQSVSRT